MSRRSWFVPRWLRPLWVVLVAVLVLGAACGSDSGTDPPATQQAPSTPDAATTTTATAELVRHSDLPTVTIGELPSEAIDTLRLIRDGGPYPYDQDGSTFQNREGLLPDYEIGFYREYTVDTPGLSHRGARRLVTGDDGAIYWTADHYASFEELVVG